MGFSIIICGAGLGGLAAAIALKRKGHQVLVLEAAPQLGEVGAGIQIPPNSSRLLKEWGVYEEVQKHSVLPQNIHMRRFATGAIIGRTPLHPAMTEQYGTPYWLIHRADYHKCLYKHAMGLGVEIRLNSLVESVDEAAPSVTLHNDEVLKADIIVGADGIRSKVRSSILGDEDVEIADSANCAFRATVPNELMRQDADTAQLMDDINANCWIGSQRHIMAYPIQNGAMYNLVMSHPGKASVGRWNEPGDLQVMKQHYADFDPLLGKVLDKVSSCLKWKLADLPRLPRWVSQSGKVVLLGDAAHAMVPYLAQGAATSIEDGAALAECVTRATQASMIPSVLRAFEAIRKPRCETIQSGSRTNGDIWHKPDGPEQQQRDEDMLATMQDRKKHKNIGNSENPNRWSDETFQPWLFGHDTISETNKQLDQLLGSESPRSALHI